MRYILLCLFVLSAPLYAVHQSIAFSETIDGWLSNDGPANPALLSADPDFGLAFRYDYENDSEELLVVRLPRWFAYAYDSVEEKTTLAGGFELIRNLHIGFDWNDTPTRDSRFDAGVVYRPLQQVSVAATAQDITRQYPDFIAGFAVRPWRNYVTLFAQHEAEWLQKDEEFQFEDWKAGLQVSPLDGLIIEGIYDQDDRVQTMLRLDFGQFAASYFAYAATDDFEHATSRQMLSWSFYNQNSLIPRHYPLYLTVSNDQPQKGLFARRSDTLTDLLLAIRNAGDDVSRIELTVRADGMSLADVEELRAAIAASHKPIHAYIDDGSLASLYLASAADRVFIAPGRPLQPGLFAYNQRSYRGLLQQLDIRVEAAKYGELSPVDESMTAAKLSNPVREHMLSLIQADWNDAWDAIDRERDLPVDLRETLREGVYLPQYAVDHGLADDTIPAPVQSADAWWKRLTPPAPDRTWKREGEVGVLYLCGTLLPGETRHPLLPEPPFEQQQTGAATLLRQLADYADAPNVKAIVLRINSGGGECGACVQVFEALRDLNMRKPVVVSVGGLCGSGAYYIASAGRRIFVDEHSRVAGLSVLGLSIDDSGFYGKLGVEVERISPASAPTADERFAVLPTLQNQLLSRIASARNLPMLEVRDLADGRMLRGAAAVEGNLADETGGLLEAISYARRIANLSPKASVRQSRSSIIPDLSPVTDPASQLPTIHQGFYYHSGWLSGN